MPDKTRAQLHQELAHAEIRVAAAEQEARQVVAHSDRERASRDPEAVAFERCSAALELLLRDRVRGVAMTGDGARMSAGMEPMYRPPAGPVERVLGYLGTRFGVEPPTVTEVMLMQRRLQATEAERDQLRYRLSQVEGALASSAHEVDGWQR